MKVIGIIGPFRAAASWRRDMNIDRADVLAQQVWKLGAAAYCPHKMTGHLYGQFPEELFLAGHLEMMRRCDAVLLGPRWQQSRGSCAEKAEAERLGIPVFHTLDELQSYLTAEMIPVSEGDDR